MIQTGHAWISSGNLPGRTRFKRKIAGLTGLATLGFTKFINFQ